MENKMSNDEIKRNMLEYYMRIEEEEDRRMDLFPAFKDPVESFDPDEEGIWHVVGGTVDDSYRSGIIGRYNLGNVEGRFSDVLAWAMQQDRFYGRGLSKDKINDSDNGYIVESESGHATKVKSQSGLEGIILNIKISRGDPYTIAWNVDTQYDFMSPLGKLYVDGAEKIEPNLKKLTDFFRVNHQRIVNTADWHNKRSQEISETPDYVNTFPEHCIKRTMGARFISATSPKKPCMVDWTDKFMKYHLLENSDEIVLYKDKFDVFSGNPHTEEVLEVLNPKRVVVYGVATNVCVDYAVRGLIERGKEVYVVEDAIQGLPNIPSPVEDWERLGVKLIRTEDLCR